MDRWACVNVRAFPLQLLLARNPSWKHAAAAVVSKDTPQGIVLWVNARARQKGIQPGVTYAYALNVDRGIRAGTITEDDVRRGIQEITVLLRDFSPDVEPCETPPGFFWINATGLGTLYTGQRSWATDILDRLREKNLLASIAVGFSRFGTFAVSANVAGISAFATATDEQNTVLSVPVAQLGLPQETVDLLELLKVRTVRDFLALPPDGVRKRFGDEAYTLHVHARGEIVVPLQPSRDEEPLEASVNLDSPESGSGRIFFRIARMVHPLIRRALNRGELITGLSWTFNFEGDFPVRYAVTPAAPTTSEHQLLELAKLRLESIELGEGIMGLSVHVDATPVKPGQATLFETDPPRDLSSANRALARVRAQFGTESTVHARLRDAHLPEASFAWEPAERTRIPKPDMSPDSPLVRRLYTSPISCETSARTFHRESGPHIISGGWWMRGVHREYHFARDNGRRLLWIYFDRVREQWFIQGEVE